MDTLTGSLFRTRRSILAKFLLFTYFFAAGGNGQGNLAAQTNRASSEYEVKAAYLLNFVRFVEWPDRGETPFTICVLGDDPFGATLDNLIAGERVGPRPIAVRRIRRWQPPCEVLFVAISEREVFQTLSRVPPGVLTVGEEPGFLRDGGLINFVIEDHRVRFDVNQRAAEAASLRISSRLLAVARTVTQ